MKSNSALILDNKEAVIQYLDGLIFNANEWLRYAATIVQNSDSIDEAERGETMRALTVIHEQFDMMKKHVRLDASVVEGLKLSLDAKDRELAAAYEALSEVEQHSDERALELADALVEMKVDEIFDSEDTIVEAQIEYIAQKMIDEENPDFVEEQERDRFNKMLHEAKDKAMHELTFNHDFDDEPEEAEVIEE